MEQVVYKSRKSHPQQKANIISSLTFFYTLGIFRKAYHKFEENDLFNVPPKYDSKTLSEQLYTQYEYDKKYLNTSIYRLLWRCFGLEYIMFGVVQLIMRSIMIVVSPWAVGRLISYFTINQTQITEYDGYFYAILVIALNLINCIYLHNYMLIITAFGFKIRTAFSSLIYRKCLKLSNDSLSKLTVGKIVTLLTKDVASLEMMALYGNDIWIGFVQIIIVCVVIYNKIGLAAITGCSFFILMIPIQVFIGKQANKLRMDVVEKSDARLQTTQEALSYMKIIKMYTWETFFANKINSCRKQEAKFIVKIFIRKVVLLLIGALTTRFAFFLLIMKCIWQGTPITAELVYLVLSSFQRLRHAVTVVIPMGIVQVAELHTAAKRIDNLLNTEELNFSSYNQNKRDPKIIMTNICVTINGTNILKNVSLSLTEPSLVALKGSVGSGKTTLLKTILKEHKFNGNLMVDGRISYASQEPWIFPGTIRQNIIFGQKFEQNRYKRVLNICELTSDVNSMENGDQTRIGDKGLNLSRGQKARINLARAVYRKSDIYLLDQCLTSFDYFVRDTVFKKCLKEFLNGKLCILATENENEIQFCDSLICLTDDGMVKSFEKVDKLNLIIEKEQKDLILENGVERIEDINDINEKSKLLPKKPQNNIYFEEKKSGKVQNIVYKKYFHFGGGYLMLFIILLLFLISHSTKIYMEKTVSNWVNLEQNISLLQLNNLTNTTNYLQLIEKHSKYYINFSCIVASTTIFAIITAYVHFNFTRKASNNLHKSMIMNILYAAMDFFDTHLIGNILNRFSKDLNIIDEQLPFILYEFFEILFTIAGIVVLLLSVKLSFIVQWVLFFMCLYFLRMFYLFAGTNLQRLDSSTKSPIIGYLNCSLDGLTTIRVHNESIPILHNEFTNHQNLHTSANYTLKCCTRAFCFVLDLLCITFVASILVQFLTIYSETLVGEVGMVITQAFSLTGLAQYGIRQWAEIENYMTSVERSLEYTEIEQEDKNGTKELKHSLKGGIIYENVSLKYSGDFVLKNLSFVIEAGQKIGIVGRTGAGKSSIISVLLRLYEIDEGKILIDNVDTKTMSVEYLRRNITVIPQDPVLFSTTIRENIDPNNVFTDAEIWHVLNRVQMKHFESLEEKCWDNFSVGEKQLICLARALISRKNIIILDEATSNLNDKTDILLQNVLNDGFSNSTVIIIAHKLKSVMNCDKVMVIDDGRLIEFNDPQELLKTENGVFQLMAQKSGLL